MALLVVIILSFPAQAQWVNTNNSFTDNSHLSVSVLNNDQTYPISVVSSIDSSVIVAWMDKRNGNSDIYAQKFDKNGVAIWATNGIPVATGSENQTYYTAGGINYEPQFYSFMATDSAGGFYIAWEDANTAAGNNKNKICIQHVKSDGTLVFGSSGFTVSGSTSSFYYTKPQLIADGNGGFFVSYLFNESGGNQKLYVFCYKDINGTLKYYGGDIMNDNATTAYASASPCTGSITYIAEVPGVVSDYQLVSNQQKGCAVIFRHVSSYSGSKEDIATNQLIRVKQNSTITVGSADPSNIYGYPQNTFYFPKDSVVVLYKRKIRSQNYQCYGTGGSSGTLYTYTQSQVIKNGMQVLETNATYTSSYNKMTVLPANGNITPAVFAWNKRNALNTSETNLQYKALAYTVYDSVPYELTSDTSASYYIGFGNAAPATFKKINTSIDTLLKSISTSYLNNFQLTSANNMVYLAAKARSFSGGATVNSVYLQKLKLENITADSCAFRMESPGKQGREVGKEINGSGQSNSITLNSPGIILNTNGDAMYYVSEYYRYIRVSPVGDSCKLLWGANGKSIGTGYIGTSPYLPQNPSAVFMPNNQRVAMFWQENSRTTYTGSGENIMLRNIDSLPNNILPARRPVSLLTTAPNTTMFTLVPQNLLGTSNSYSSFEVLNGTGTQQYSLIAEVLDNNNLGAVSINVYQHAGTVRQTGGTFYLNRNYSITPANQPTTPVTVRLFFTNEEYNALRAADPLITSVANLAVTKLNGNTAPASFPGGAAQLIVPEDWQAVNGGYYVQFKVSSFSSFWIHRNTNTALPATLGNMFFTCNGYQPTLRFNTITENNLAKFEVELYNNNNWQKQFTISAKNNSTGSNYQQILNATGLYRIKLVDKDNSYIYSKSIDVNCNKQNIVLSVYPNPVKDILKLSVSEIGGMLKLYNATGQLILQHNIFQNNNNISVSKIATGIYTLIYQQKDGTITKQTIIKQ